jgi:hypothetical protein
VKYEIKNWSSFQQYKDDRPMHWIKLHNSLLEDYSFNQLPEITQLHLLKLWMLASKNGGKLEGDNQWFSKLLNTKKVDIDLLVQSGFLVRTDPYEIVPREEKRREEESREDKTREENNIVTLKHDEAHEVFRYWQETLNHTKSAFDKDRRAFIVKWLSVYDSDYLKKAIHGCSVTPFNMGDNDRGQVYDSLKLIFKNADQIDRFAKNSDNPPAGKITTIQQTQDRALAQASRIKKHLGWEE